MQSSGVSHGVSVSPFGSIWAVTGVEERLQEQHRAGFAGLEVEVFPGIHIQNGLAAGAQDPGLEVRGRAILW